MSTKLYCPWDSSELERITLGHDQPYKCPSCNRNYNEKSSQIDIDNGAKNSLLNMKRELSNLTQRESELKTNISLLEDYFLDKQKFGQKYLEEKSKIISPTEDPSYNIDPRFLDDDASDELYS
ncbi:MAG: hypothetical protein ACOC1P_00190 [Minisyncoccales bacterium]